MSLPLPCGYASPDVCVRRKTETRTSFTCLPSVGCTINPGAKTSTLRSSIHLSILPHWTHWWRPSSRPIGIRVLASALEWSRTLGFSEAHVAPHCMGRTLRSGLHWMLWRRTLRQWSALSQFQRLQEDVLGPTAVMLDQGGLLLGLVWVVVVEVHEVVQSFDTYGVLVQMLCCCAHTNSVRNDRLIR